MRLTNFLVRDAIIPQPAGHGRRGRSARPDRRPRRQAASHRRDGRGTRTRPATFRDDDLPDIVRAVMRREELGTTGIGHGIAIPHSRHPSVDRLIGTLALSRDGSAVREPRREPVYVFFLLVSPQDRPGDHLRALEAVVRTMRDEDFVRRLRACQTADEIWALLETAAPGW